MCGGGWGESWLATSEYSPIVPKYLPRYACASCPRVRDTSTSPHLKGYIDALELPLSCFRCPGSSPESLDWIDCRSLLGGDKVGDGSHGRPMLPHDCQQLGRTSQLTRRNNDDYSVTTTEDNTGKAVSDLAVSHSKRTRPPRQLPKPP